MKRFSEQFKKKSDSIRLTARQRSDLRARLVSYMEYHPLPAEMKIQEKRTVSNPKNVVGIISEPFKTISINMTYVRSFAGVFALFLVVGIPIIAERTVPGDMLYAVKTNITEEVRASLKLSPYAKVEWETQRLERRIAEARLLASEGKLTSETEATVAEAVKEHTDAANEEIAVIRETNEDEAAIATIAFASALSVQSDVLEGHIKSGGQPEAEGHSITALAGAINDASEDADVAQADVAPSYEALLAKVETETTRAYELFESVQKRADAEEILDIERRLADVERKLVEAITLQNGETFTEVTEVTEVTDVEIPDEEEFEEVVSSDSMEGADIEESEDTDVSDNNNEEESLEEAVVEEAPESGEDDAIKFLRIALTDLQKLILFMTDIDVRENVTIEELVPVTFTEEERVEKILNLLDTVLLAQSDVEARIIPDELSEKVTAGSESLIGYLAIVAQMLEVGNIDEAERVIAEAYTIAQDLQKLVVDTSPVEVVEDESEEGTETEEGEETEAEVGEDEETEEETETEEEGVTEEVPNELGGDTVSEEIPTEEVVTNSEV